MYLPERPALSAPVLTLPAKHYTDPEIHRQEIDRIWARTWLCVAREEELPRPGAFAVKSVAGASVLLVRREDGRLGAYHNVCRHRGTLLCGQDSGQASKFQCPYHAWTYGLDGRLLSAPHMDQVADFREAEYPLAAVPVGAWDGHVFVNLDPAAAPLSAQLGPLTDRFRAWGMADLRRVERRVYPLKANWKLVIQNYSECLHCPVVHPQLQKRSHYMSGANEPPQPHYLGGRMDLRPGFESLDDQPAVRRPLPGLDESQRRHIHYYAVLPSLLLNLHPDYMLTFTLWPRAHDATDVVCEWHFHPDEIARPGFDPSGAISFWELTNRQDWELSERAQAGISSRGYRPGPYSNREDLLMGLDRYVLDRLAGKDVALPTSMDCAS
jgi:Rieske 2Fe-2S family protein